MAKQKIIRSIVGEKQKEPHGDIYLSGPLPQEVDEPEINDLPRLIVDFNRMDYGRLRYFIDEINSD